MCRETRIPRDMCAGNRKLGETRITVTLATIRKYYAWAYHAHVIVTPLHKPCTHTTQHQLTPLQL